MAFGIDDAIAAGLKIIDKFVPDQAAKAEAEAALRSSLQGWDAAQAQVNAAEAGHRSLFVAGWRPWIGWSCGMALCFQYVVTPVGMWLAAIFNIGIPPPPSLDDILWELIFAMLGMGGLRTYEKMKGVAK